MPYGPEGKIDWPAGCDPYWSDINAGCSDFAGDYINPNTGSSINSLDLTNLLRGIQNAITPKPAATGTQPASKAPAAANNSKTDLSKDPVKWLGEGNNSLYVAVIFIILMLLVLAAKSGRK